MLGGGEEEVAWAVFELTGTLSWVAGYYNLPKKHDKCLPDTLLEGWGGGGIGHAWNRPYNILDTRHLCEHFRID